MFLALVPLKKELNLIERSLEQLGLEIEVIKSPKEKYLRISSLNLYLVKGGFGEENHQQRGHFWLKKLTDTQGLITLGSAGTLSDELKLQDIILATSIHSDREKTFKCSLFEKQARDDFGFKLHYGALLSHPKAVSSNEQRTQLFEKSKAQAVTMESLASARLAEEFEIPYGEIRGITDQANEALSSQFDENLPQAMLNVSKILVSLLQSAKPNH